MLFHRMGALLLSVLIAGPAGAQSAGMSSKNPAIDTSIKDPLVVLSGLQAADIRMSLSQASDHGLSTGDYWTSDLENEYLQMGSLSPSSQQKALKGFLRYLRHLNSGVVNPGDLGDEFKINPKPSLDAKQLTVLMLTTGASANALVQALTPQSPPYRSLQAALKRMNDLCTGDTWPEVANPAKPLKLGSVSPVVAQIKTRLRQLGYNITTIDENYDTQTLQAVNDVQSVLRYKPDGVISPSGRTWRYLNASCFDRINQIRYDMEKLRWFPRDFGNRYIYVNLAMTYLTLVDKDQNRIETMRTINGRVTRKTPTLIDKVVQVIVNPFWVVPPTVFKEDKLADLRGLDSWSVADYFDSHHYEVFSQDFSRKFEPWAIDWTRVTVNSPIYIRQLPGLHNSLGVLKFLLTNDFAIYLHDTNQRELFAESDRQLSSGCVRVERPYDLAEYLLQGTAWDRYAIDTKTAQFGEVLDRDTPVKVPAPIPVYLVFQTSTLSSDGVIRFAEDTYQQGERLRQRMLQSVSR